MTERATKSVRPPKSGPAKSDPVKPDNGGDQALGISEGYGVFLEANGQNLDAFVKSSEALGNGLAALGEEFVAFSNARMRTQFENSETLMSCHDFEDVFALQCDYLNKAAEQYAQETGKVMGLMTQMTRDCMAPFEQRAKAALHQLNQD